MVPPDIVKVRLHNQQIATSSVSNVQELVSHMGALQAQDYDMVKWAMGLRLPGTNLEDIEAAIARGDIIRTHLLRPTWHVVAAQDLRWMLELTDPRVKIAMRSHSKKLGLTEKRFAKSNSVIAKALEGSRQLTRKKIVPVLEKAGFENKNNLASLLLLRAELDGIICSGPSKGKDYTYALLDEQVPQSESITKEEALERLARTYFTSHGPATLDDFSWWSGLTKTSARKAMEMIQPDFNTAEIDRDTNMLPNPVMNAVVEDKIFLLPAYDEFIISYKKRTMLIPDDENYKKAVSNNGIFRPAIVHNGKVIGVWKRSVKKETVVVETDFFSRPTKKIMRLVEKATQKFASFLGNVLKMEAK